MGGVGSGRPASGKKDNQRLTLEEKIERNRVRARERWQRLRDERESGQPLKGSAKYNQYYREKYNRDEERLGHLREAGKGFSVKEDPNEWMKYIRNKNKERLDIILNDVELMERVFSDRDDISDLQKAAQRQKKYLSVKEIAEIERKLNEEFNLVEDRRGNYQTTYRKTNEDGE